MPGIHCENRTEAEEAFCRNAFSPFMHTDCTNAKVNGKSAYVQESIYPLCKCMSELVMMRQKEEQNLFERISQIFLIQANV